MRNRKRVGFVFPHILLLLLIMTIVATIVWAQSTLRITIIGDSTVCNYAASKYPMTGWGQVLQLFFADGSVSINNRAIGGRSTRSFYQEGRWAEIVPNLQKGEYVFIQFGHNDRDYSKAERYTDTTDYKEYLRKYVKESRAKGAVPVLISPMNMNAWNGTNVRTVFREGANNYRGAMMNVAKELSVPFIDLEAKSVAHQGKVGQTYNAKYVHLGLDPGEYPNYPNGISDGTHFQEMGANLMAKFVCEGIRELEADEDVSKLAEVLKPQFNVAVSANKSNIGMITETGNSFPPGVAITLKVTPKSGEQFLGWFDASGQNVSNKRIHTFKMPVKSVSYVARFEGGAQQYALSTSVADGEGSVNPSEGSYDEGTEVDITASGETGWLFDHWSGDATGTDNPVTVIMTADKSVSAHFVKDPRTYYTITAQAAPGGNIVQSPEGAALVEGTEVRFTAIPDAGWVFAGWEGDHTGTDTVYTISQLKSDMTLHAGFIPVDPTAYEAEDGVMNAAVLEKVNDGFSGAGYVNFDNEAGSSVEVAVYAFEAGEKTVTVSYSNGATTSRQVSFLVNDSVAIDAVDFSPTQGWETWAQKSVALTFRQGANTIKIVSVSEDGGPNIDRIGIEQQVSVVRHHTLMSNRIHTGFSHGFIRFDNVCEPFMVELFSINGRKIFGKSIRPINGAATFLLPIDGLKQGQYILRTTIGKKRIINRFNYIRQ